jgi:hypothetical protein
VAEASVTAPEDPVEVRHQCQTHATVPTKRRRHAITETPPVQAALDELRDALGGERVEMGELVTLGAQEKLARLRAERDDTAAVRRRLATRLPPLVSVRSWDAVGPWP